jgi:hypothetical protein
MLVHLPTAVLLAEILARKNVEMGSGIQGN